jgi:hypothetical protein
MRTKCWSLVPCSGAANGGASRELRRAGRPELCPTLLIPTAVVRWLISDFFSVATSPGGDFYMATTTGSAVSRDGGRRWVPLKIDGPLLLANDSEGAQFGFLSDTHGWLLLQSEALLQTVDGYHWTVLSSAPSGA